eukprot:gene17944-biopygen18522
MHSGGSPAAYDEETMERGALKVPKKIDTRVIDRSFFQEARDEGVICYEPCGDLCCAGLEMLLRCGVKVNMYLYQDVSPASQAVASRTRGLTLSRRHPDLLPAAAIQLEQLPPNLEDTKLEDLVVRERRTVRGTKIREEVFPLINNPSVVGQPVSFDATCAGSYTHRLRAYYWSNLFQNHQFNLNSRAFRAPRAGTVVRDDDIAEEGESREVNLDEKAIAMGYSASELRMPDGMGDEELAGVLGLVMDRRRMELLFAVAEASITGLPRSAKSQEVEHAWRAYCHTHGKPRRNGGHSGVKPGAGTSSFGGKMDHEGQKGTQGLGATKAVQRSREWKLVPMKVKSYKARHRMLFVKAGSKPITFNKRPCGRITRAYTHEDEWCLKWLKTRGPVDFKTCPRMASSESGGELLATGGTRPREAATIASAFRNHVLSVFGAPAECLVDGGTEFEGAFADLCRQCLIDRRVTSRPDSPEGNGLTERVVKTINYNAAKQQSTGVAPFTLLFAQKATVPPDLRKRPELNFEDQEEETIADDLLQRTNIVKTRMVHAGCSLEIAQHRDTLLYEHRRSGGYEPKPHQFKAGDFVYIRKTPRSGMEVVTKPAILKLVKVQRDGVVVLEDSTKLGEQSTVQSIAPCHLQVKDQYDCSAAIPSKHLACEKYKLAAVEPKLKEKRWEQMRGCYQPMLVHTGARVQVLTRTQVKVASQLEWGLELVMTVPHEVKRLANAGSGLEEDQTRVGSLGWHRGNQQGDAVGVRGLTWKS